MEEMEKMRVVERLEKGEREGRDSEREQGEAEMVQRLGHSERLGHWEQPHQRRPQTPTLPLAREEFSEEVLTDCIPPMTMKKRGR